jgi:hypothetical protein
MRTASPRRALTAISPRRAAPAPLLRAVRAVDRWSLLAGVTGVLANILLVILFTTPADGPYAWTGPANDTVGVVATLAMIPVAAGLLAVCGNRPGLGAITSLAIVAMVVMAAVSMLFMLGLVPFAAQVDSSYAGLILIFGWVFAASRAGRASGRLPRQVATCGVALGAAGLAGAALLAASVPMPAHSLIRDITWAAGALAGAPVALAFPVWLIVLSYRLPGHLADRADCQGRSSPRRPSSAFIDSRFEEEQGALPCPAYAGSLLARAAHQAASGHCATPSTWPATSMPPWHPFLPGCPRW